MKKILAIINLSVISAMIIANYGFSMAFAQTINNPNLTTQKAQLNTALNVQINRDLETTISLPDELHPDFAPDVKISGGAENKKGYEAAYSNFILQLVAGGLLYLAGPVAILMIAIGGQRYVTSHGNQNMMEGAKKTLTWAIVGLLIVILSYAIVKAIISIVVATA